MPRLPQVHGHGTTAGAPQGHRVARAALKPIRRITALAPIGLILAATADSLTFLLLPPGAALNPLAVASPPLAIAAKAALAALILIAPLQQYRRPVITIGITAWTIGFASNLLVLGG